MTTETLKWWDRLTSQQKTRLCDVNTEVLGSIRRWETLTNLEIQILYEMENESDRQIIESVFEYPPNCCILREGKTKMNKGCMERNNCEQKVFKYEK